MIVLLDTIETVLAQLLDNDVFDDPEGGTSTMRSFIQEIPPKRESGAQGEDYPFRLIRLSDFDITREGMRYTVEVTIGLYEAGNGAAAVTMLGSVITLIEGLPNQRFAPYKLIGEPSGAITDDSQHPYYQITLRMVFRGVN